VRNISLSFPISDIFLQYNESVVGTYTNQVDDAYCLLNPYADELFNCVIDLIGDQPILCQRRLLTRKLISDTRLHCDPDYSSQRVVIALDTLSTSLIPQLRHAHVETFALDRNMPLRILARYK